MSGVTRRDALQATIAGGAAIVGTALAAGAAAPAAAAVAAAPAQPLSRTARYREMLKGCFYAPAIDDPLEAKLIVRAGLRGAIVSGIVASYRAGYADLAMASVTEILDVARELCDAADINLLVDLEDGKGSPLHLYRWIKETERTGASAAMIDDTGFHGHLWQPKGKVITQEEMVDKIKAAVDARTDPNFVIMVSPVGLREGHTENETLDRGAAYAEAGADLFWFPGGSSDFLRKVKRVVNRPLIWTGLGTTFSADEKALMDERTVNMVVIDGYRSIAAGAIAAAIDEFLKTGSTVNAAKGALSDDAMAALDIRYTSQQIHDMAKKYHVK
ncbi:MAG: isocitrate lyase/phosphoenolpyruvate mutase family protein [Gammaproteobacteria bacterium]